MRLPRDCQPAAALAFATLFLFSSDPDAAAFAIINAAPASPSGWDDGDPDLWNKAPAISLANGAGNPLACRMPKPWNFFLGRTMVSKGRARGRLGRMPLDV